MVPKYEGKFQRRRVVEPTLIQLGRRFDPMLAGVLGSYLDDAASNPRNRRDIQRYRDQLTGLSTMNVYDSSVREGPR